jgi:hypothetical protein
MNTQPKILITFDVDWAPDFMIDFALKRLVDAGVPATWFITHYSPALIRLSQNPDFFELGIHPNFMRGSTQGKTESEILQTCLSIVPTCRAMRTHGLMQSSNILDLCISQGNLMVDASIFLPLCKNISVVRYLRMGKVLNRIPYYWEDDYAIDLADSNEAVDIWDVDALVKDNDGIMIFNFHPIHVYLNTADFESYERLKKVNKNLTDLNEDEVRKYINPKLGARTFFDELLKKMRSIESKIKLFDLVS